MADNKVMRLNKVLREMNISLDRAVEFLNSKGIEIEARPTTKISGDIYKVLSDQFQTDANKKVASKEVGEEKRKEKEALRAEREQEEERKKVEELKRQEIIKAKATISGPKTVGSIDLDAGKTQPEKPQEAAPELEKEPKAETKTEAKTETPEVIETRKTQVQKPKVLKTIDLEKTKQTPRKKKRSSKKNN
jgi:translation initiation factor IF-2